MGTNQQARRKPTLSPEEIEQQQVTELPPREAMTLIDTGSSLLGAYPDTADGLGAFDGTSTGDAAPPDTGGTADTTTRTLDTYADASGSESGTPNVTDSDRSEQITQSDSAVAGPS